MKQHYICKVIEIDTSEVINSRHFDGEEKEAIEYFLSLECINKYLNCFLTHEIFVRANSIVLSDYYNNLSILDQFKYIGIEIDNHCSDLYVPVNKTTTKIIDSYEYKCNVTTFISQIDGKPWYEIPFAYEVKQ